MIAQKRKIASKLGCIIAILSVAGCASQSGAPVIATSKTAERSVEISSANAAVSVAMQQVGVPYRYGGASPQGFDCSGLVHYAYSRAGLALPRTTSGLWSAMQPVRKEDVQVGDILFFRIAGKMSHVGLYVGGNRFVHAPSSGRVVEVGSLRSPFYDDAFIRAGRPR